MMIIFRIRIYPNLPREQPLHEAALLAGKRVALGFECGDLGVRGVEDAGDPALLFLGWDEDRYRLERDVLQPAPLPFLVALRGVGRDPVPNVVRFEEVLDETGVEAASELEHAVDRAHDAGLLVVVTADGAVVGRHRVVDEVAGADHVVVGEVGAGDGLVEVLALGPDRVLADGDDALDGGAFVLLALPLEDRKSTRLNSSHVAISYAVFCLKKKRKDK